MKRLLCLLLAFLLTGCQTPRALPADARASERPVLILMYHSILKDPARQGKYILSPDQLKADMRYLLDAGFTPVSLSELIDFADGRGDLPDLPVVLTFDDGYLNNLTYLLPLLIELDCRAVISVVGEYAKRFTDTPDPNPNYAHLSLPELAELTLSDRVELANHSYNMHAQTARMGSGRKNGESDAAYADAFTADTLACQELLLAYTKTAPVAYAYPFGVIDPDSGALLAKMGFRVTLTCFERISTVRVGDPDSLFGLGRYNRPGGVDTERFLAPILAAHPGLRNG